MFGLGAEGGGGGEEGGIHLCGFGDAFAEDFDLHVAEGSVESDGHGGGLSWVARGLSRMSFAAAYEDD